MLLGESFEAAKVKAIDTVMAIVRHGCDGCCPGTGVLDHDCLNKAKKEP